MGNPPEPANLQPAASNNQKFYMELSSLANTIEEQADKLLGETQKSEHNYRKKLAAAGCIHPLPAGLPENVESLCAVDGAKTDDKLYAADLLVACAYFDEGKVGTVSHRDFTDFEPPVWADIRPHAGNNTVIGEAAMGMLEMYTITHMPHQYRILDGSFQTPLIGMRKALADKQSEEVKEAVARLVLHPRFSPVTSASKLYTASGTRPIIALPKSDSDKVYVTRYAKQFSLPEYRLADRMFSASMLQPGEMLEPRPLTAPSTFPAPHANSSSSLVKEAQHALHLMVERFVNLTRETRGWTFYMKPLKSATVLRVEFFLPETTPVTPNSVLEYATHLARIVQADTAPPQMLEPFAQWRVDAMISKRASLATQYIKQELASDKERAMVMMRAYRT